MLSAAVRGSLRRARLVVYLVACFLIFGGLYAAGASGGKMSSRQPAAYRPPKIRKQATR